MQQCLGFRFRKNIFQNIMARFTNLTGRSPLTGRTDQQKKNTEEAIKRNEQNATPSTTGKKSYVNKRGQRIFEGDPNYNPNEAGANTFYEGGQQTEGPKPETPQENSGGSSEQNSGGGGLSDAEREALQAQIDAANQQAAAAEAAKKQSYETNQRLVDQQKEQYAKLDERFGDISAQIKNIIGGVEQETGKQVMIDDDFMESAQKINEKFGHNAELRDKFLRDLATNNAKTTAEGQGNAPAGAGGATYSENGGQVEGAVSAMPEVEESINSALASFDPENPGASLMEMMNDPNVTSEEILLGSLLTQLSSSQQASKRVEDFLTKAAERTRRYFEDYEKMMLSHKGQAEALIENQKEMAEARYKQMEDEIRAQKIETMEDLTDKRSRLEGYMKAKLKAQGVLDSSYGVNQLTTSITKYDAMMVATEADYDRQVREIGYKREETIFNLTAKLIEINQGYESKLFEASQSTESKIDDINLSILENANEQEEKELSAMGDYFKNILSYRAEQEKASREAMEAARKELNEHMKYMTEQTGYIFTTKNGEVVPLIDENGEAIMNWDQTKERNKEQWEREKFNSDRAFDWEKEEFAQWEAKTNIALDRWYKEGLINDRERDNARFDMEEERKANEFKWERSADYAEEGIPRWEQSDLFSRTDRHNNPTATAYPSKASIKILTDMGFEEGKDFWAGDKFGGGVTMAFKNIDTGIAATTAFLSSHQINSHYGTDGYGGKGHVVSAISDILMEEGIAKKPLPMDLKSGTLQKLFNKIPEWRKPEVTMAIYEYENAGAISSGAFAPMTKDGKEGEVNLPVWEKFTLNNFANRYQATKEDMEELEKLWAEERKTGMGMNDFLKMFRQNMAGGSSGGTAPAPTGAATPAPAEKSAAASFLGF
jgi:hypothetical protein